MNTSPVVAAGLALRHAGITHTSVPRHLARGYDNTVLSVTTTDGRALVVRVAVGGRARFDVAHAAGQRAARHQIPVPAVLWHDQHTCVETRLPGTDLTAAAGLDPLTRLAAAAHAGRLLRRWHTIKAVGFGPLDTHCRGRHTSAAGWLLALPERAATGLHPKTFERAAHVLGDHARTTPTPSSRLLHGDLAARHLLSNGSGTITGMIDLDSARAGDPLSEIAGWTLRGPCELQQALIDAYFAAPPTDEQRHRIALYRVRIALSLLAFHTARGDKSYAAALARLLTGDLGDLAADRPRLLPRPLPPGAQNVYR